MRMHVSGERAECSKRIVRNGGLCGGEGPLQRRVSRRGGGGAKTALPAAETQANADTLSTALAQCGRGESWIPRQA